MPKARRYTMPAGDGWQGGIIGGRLIPNAGETPWSVEFRASGSRIEKMKKFKKLDAAKRWRQAYSNKTARTMNRWRYHPYDPDTVEMVVGPSCVVLYDADLHAELSTMSWCSTPRGRVYTTGRILTTKNGSNEEIRSKRAGVVDTRRTLSMLTVILGDTIRSPRRRVGVTPSVIDNRRSNFASLSSVKSTKHVAAT